MKKIILPLLAVLSIIPISLFAQSYSTLSFEITPNLNIPVGSIGERYTMGGGGCFTLGYKPPVSFPVYFSLDLGYDYIPVNISWSSPVHSAFIGAGAGLNYRFLGRLAADLHIKGGYYRGFIKDVDGKLISGGNLYIDTGGGLYFYINPSLKIGINSSFKNYFGSSSSLYRAVSIGIGTSYRIPLSGSIDLKSGKSLPAKLKIKNIQMNTVFPVFYKYYDSHPVGRITIENKERGSIENVQASLFIKQYMDYPKKYEVASSLKKGESKTVDLYALFNEKVLEITEGAKVSAEFNIYYSYKNSPFKVSTIETVNLQNRNASVWDDDRRAAAFITARDPAVLKMGKNVAGIVRLLSNKVFGENFNTVLAIHKTLSLYGLGYVVDPKTPYKEFHQKREAIDFLQFPRQTLLYKAGDCDDLSILYAALFQALSINTALITVPGHIYVAFDLDIKPEKAKSIFYNHKDLIFKDGKTWMPFEVTMIGSSFGGAWRQGALQWRRYSKAGKAGFYPVSEAWKEFEPVGLPGRDEGIDMPDLNIVQSNIKKELDSTIKAEMAPLAEDLKIRIAKTNGSPKLINKLGVLYARYGLYTDAEKKFMSILKNQKYAPAMVNMGNLLFLKGKYKEAEVYYRRAYSKYPDNPKIMINLAKIYYRIDRFNEAKKLYKKASLISPEIAESYAYLSGEEESSARADDVQKKQNLLWEE